MKKEAILILGIILFSSIALAESLHVTTQTSPEITFAFTEEVTIVSANLTRAGKTYPLISSYIGNCTILPNGMIYASKYKAIPQIPLMNSEYMLWLIATDFVNNTMRRNETMTVEIPYMKIWVSNPPYSVSPTRNFTIEIKTEKPAKECRYAYIDIGYENAMFNFSYIANSGNNSIFRKNNFNSDNYLSSPQAEKKIYVYCNDMYQRVHPRVLNISYDLTRPVTGANADPRIIVEKIDGKVISKIKVSVSPDSKASPPDKVVCNYTRSVKKAGTNCTYIPSTDFIPFKNYNQRNKYDYVSNPVQNIDVTNETTLARGCSFNYTVRCRNQAGYYSINMTVPIRVDLMAPAEITKISPPDVSKNISVFLNFTTSKKAECFYSVAGNKSGTGDMSGVLSTTIDQKQHTKSLGDFKEGKYKIILNCSAAEGAVGRAFPFIIDLSPPSTPVIKVPAAVCTKSLPATFSATDSLSGVAGFNYSVEGVLGVLKTGSASGNPAKDSVSRINFTNHSIYTFKAIAQDKVGFWSAQGVGNSTLYDETGVSCDNTPPLVYLAKNRTAEGYVVYLECIDMQTSCNNNSFIFSFSEDSTCLGAPGPIYYDANYIGFAKLVPSTTYFCFEASDIAGNTAKGNQLIEISQQEHCANSITDVNETDIDCGGLTTCERCITGKLCLFNSDCKSGFCNQAGFCSDVACDDLVKNGLETDIDCGGITCNPCSLNESCFYNSDCISNFCDNGICAAASCTDSSENGDETDIDCGGSCTSKCANQKKCKKDADCTSGYCSGVGTYKLCAQRLGDETQTGGKKIPAAKTAFVSLGILSMLGSIGYLSYLKFMPAPARLPPAFPRAPPRAPSTPPPAAPASPARPPARRETEFERLGKLGEDSKLERLGRGKGEEGLERLKSKSEFEKLERIRKPTKLEKLGKGIKSESIQKLNPKKKPKKIIESLRK